jgi:hypothetical protein
MRVLYYNEIKEENSSDMLFKIVRYSGEATTCDSVIGNLYSIKHVYVSVSNETNKMKGRK